jgi:DNA-binding response OmpR family regulator
LTSDADPCFEDDQRVAELIKRGLEEDDHTATIAYDGFLGRKLALNNSFDLIITDVILPKINGLDLCRDIRNVNLEVS